MKVQNIDDLYKLSPLQHDLLPASMPAQAIYAIDGPLDLARFKSAWEQALSRHATLRTTFHSKGLEKPVQVVQQKLSLLLDEHDWESLSPGEQSERLKAFVNEERSRAFDLTRAPLLCLSLIRFGTDVHRLVWTYHPLVLDHASASMVAGDVFSIYRQHELPAAASFREYISWLRQQDQSQARDFWTETLRGCESPSTLDGVPAVRAASRNEQQVRLSDSLSTAIQRFAAEHRLSLASLLVSAWALLLGRYNDQDNVVFGVIFSGRPASLPQSDSIAGPFSNVLPAHVTVPQKTPLLAWFKRVNDWYSKAAEYQHIGQQEIRSWSNLPDVAYESVVSVASTTNIVQTTEPRVELLDQFSHLDHPLAVTLREGEPLSLTIAYDESRFHNAFIGRLLTQLTTIFEAAIAKPEQRVADVSLLTADEQKQLTEISQSETVAQCMHDLFERQVESTPDAIALVFGYESLTYAELNERANQLAHHLHSLGVRAETNVGVCMYRSIDTVVGLLAILKAGGVYIPLDPQLPAERLSFMLEETNVPVLLTQQDLLFDLPPIVAASEVVCLDMEWTAIAQQSSDNPRYAVSPDQLAYIIYTSGSTGRPKGVCIPHGAAATHLTAIQSTFALNAKDRVLQFASLSFDVSIEQILAPMCAGATVVLRPSDVWNVSEFWEQVVEQQLTVLNLPPAYWNQMTQELDHDAVARAAETLRLMIIGGDAMPPEVVLRWQNSPLKHVRLLNAYGPTETIITASTYDVPANFGAKSERLPRIPIGRRVGARRLYVLDRNRELAVTAGRGELFIGGVELARGYFNDPALTADRFIPDPFSSQPGSRMYSTGDVVRRLAEGDLTYEGRRDGQIKLRGYRIELGDIESALGAEPDVHECAGAVKEREGEKRLVAYVVLRPDARLQAWELRAKLKERLPEHMVPAAIIELESLPLTSSGKIDRRALPEPDESRPEQEASFAEPTSEIEEKLVKIWTELLGITRIGVLDNFFEAGGDSLLATQLIARVNKHFNASIPLRALFDQPTITDLARNIEVVQPESHESIVQTARNENIPLSYAQERLWFVNQLQPNSPLFNIGTAVHLRGDLNREALEQTFGEIVRRHETLRTVFEVVDGNPVQVVREPQPFEIPLTDLSELNEPEKQSEMSRLIDDGTRRPFDLTQLPLLRVSLLRLVDDEHVLILAMHHIVSDGWSIGVLVREVAELYEAFCAGRPSPLPELSLQYADFAAWQRDWLQGETLAGQLDYWRQQLAGQLPESPLAGDRARPSITNFRGQTRTFEISKSLSERLKQLGKEESATLFMTLMAAFQTLLHKQSGQEDIVVGTDVANRNRTEVEDLIGFFVNLLPVRTRPSGQLTFREYLRQVKEVTLGAYEHQDLPFDRLVAELQPERTLNRAPLFQTLFVMQNAPVPPVKLANLELRQMEIDEGVAKFDLAVFMEETDEGLIGRWNYSTEIFESSTIERLAARFARLLESIVNDPEAKLSALEMRDESETAQRQQELKRSLLRRATRQSIKPADSVVKTSYLPGCERLPLVIEPALDDVELAEWASHNPAFIETELHKHGALLFRNFRIASVSDFERCAATICPELFSEYGDLPREQMGRSVYGSTPYPANQTILFHNESSHLDRWPMKIWFFCLKAAQTGGETPIVDCRRVYELLPPQIRETFAAKGLRYVRNYTEGLDVSWSDFFHTTQRVELEKQCRERRIEWQWQKNNGLRTSKNRPALARHPKTNEVVFFNQMQLHHSSCLEPAVRESLLSTFGKDGLPRNVYYGDGTSIEDDVMAEVGAVYREACVAFPWQEGDIMMLDNMLVAHGRNPFVGERKIVVALGEMCHEEAHNRLEEAQKKPLSATI